MSGPASARGLFRATGKTSRPVAVVAAGDLAGTIERAEHLPREIHDFYPTPPEPTLALVHHEGARLHAFHGIWEPACGNGAMADDLRGCGLTVVESDLVDRTRRAGCLYGAPVIRSFFEFDRASRMAPAIVTNPPFAAINWRDGRGQWLTHALDVLQVDYMALLLSWSWPGAAGLGAVWAAHPPARVYLMRWKIDFTGQGAPPMLNGWFVWDKAHAGPTELRMMDRADARRGDGQGDFL